MKKLQAALKTDSKVVNDLVAPSPPPIRREGHIKAVELVGKVVYD